MKLSARWKPDLSLNTWIRIGASVAIVLAVLAHEAEWVQFRPVQQMELFAYDARLRLFMPRTLDPRVVILDIDEKSLNAEGRWPWSRNKLAVMVKQLFEHYKVRVMGFDVAFAEPDPSSGLATLEALATGERKDDPEYLARAAEMVATNVVSVTTYVVVGEDLATVMAARDTALGGHRAASTLVTVPALARPEWRMEIAVIAAS